MSDRAVPGHWEGDLIIGKNGKSAMRNVQAREVKRLSENLRRSLTWDQGKEMAGHVQFAIDTNVNVYFCGP